jgi:hypothetical protein
MAEETQSHQLPDGATSEWRPSRATIWAWAILSIPIFILAMGAYLNTAAHGASQAGGSIGLMDMLAVAALSIAIVGVHEAVHGVFMVAFGAKPQFGVLTSSGIPVGLYATAPGYHFSRARYLMVCLAPLAILSPLGLLLCWLPFGGYFVIPFALQLAGCIGDATIAWHVLHAPRGSLCEDMRDGTRFWPAAA